jgi:hypothetical protein
VTLEPFHPTGRVGRVLVLGRRCPEALPPPAAEPADTEADLVLIAPSAAELARRGWLAQAAGRAAAALTQDGVVYALLPRGRRGAAGRRLRAAGLVLEPALAQLPGREAPRYLVPLEADLFGYALGRLIGARPRVRRGLVALRGLPFGGSLLEAILPAVGLVARRPGAAPLAAWTAGLVADAQPPARIVLATSWRGPHGPIVLYCFAEGQAEPWGVAKVGPGSRRETELLDRLGPSAGTAGARVPRLLGRGSAGDQPVLVETPLDGRPAAELLMRSPDRFAEVTSTVADWLERWNGATARAETLPVARLEQDLLEPLAELDAAVPHAASYRDRLAERCAALAGAAVPLVATHNDLTMWNVLLDASGTLGVLDWAEAEDAGLPLSDFFYALVDAAAACDGDRSRLDALRSCFEPGGARADVTAALRERLRTSLALDGAVVELSFHACWLRHACNEARSRTAPDGPFLEIVRWLARQSAEAP